MKFEHRRRRAQAFSAGQYSANRGLKSRPSVRAGIRAGIRRGKPARFYLLLVLRVERGVPDAACVACQPAPAREVRRIRLDPRS